LRELGRLQVLFGLGDGELIHAHGAMVLKRPVLCELTLPRSATASIKLVAAAPLPLPGTDRVGDRVTPVALPHHWTCMGRAHWWPNAMHAPPSVHAAFNLRARA